MGLNDAVDDLLPDSSGSDDSGGGGSTDSERDLITIGKPPYDKHFEPEHFEEIKEVMPSKLGYTVNEAKNLPADERYEVFHEAALIARSELDPEESETAKSEKCQICGSVLHEDATAVISGEKFCSDHPAIQVANHFEE